ncbi:MAG TPA: membrane integrity-associated transporter subunit PqiC [Myxococcales bacterium]|nr:membrane integrity-associated transporter subunit PqiC [Myxococcales bacterium]
MMTFSRRFLTRHESFRAISATLSLLMVAGCLGRSPDVRHFVLGVSNSSETSARAMDVAVLVGPVRLPAYLERSQMARLEDDGEIVLDEFGRWLGGFEENLLRAITLGLARELGSDRIVSAPSKAPFPFDYQIRIHVDDMILQDGELLAVRIRWALLPRSDQSEPRFFVMDERFAASGSSPADLVRAHDAALLSLVHRISDEIGKDHPAR